DRPVRAWTALRVVAGAGGARRGAGLEAPFVGRDRELQTVIDVAEDTVVSRAARLVTVTGDAGAGKSRLLWEFFKHVDGIEAVRWWHQGRCLSYGDGVAYWALAEMVRARAGISEEEDAEETARVKLQAAIELFVTDERERRLVEPRLAQLLGMEQRAAREAADLFSGWRLFFERMADQAPVILVFEDLQWADSGLLEFIDYLLEWSADHPIFILALGRPELEARRPDWGTSLRLAPLVPDAMRALLDGLVPGLPADLADRIQERAEGMPLYAVETVRMLLDRGLLAEEGSRYVVAGAIDDLEVPETLQALVAARLDNLDPAERALLQDASVLGISFTPSALVAVSDRLESDVRHRLDALVANQVLGRNDDQRSGEPGQYHFLQALLRTIALGTLSRRDRKARHLAAAEHLRSVWGDAPEIAEVLASHYLNAVAADPDAPDADAIRGSARDTLTAAGHRAVSLALGSEARVHFERAAELTDDHVERSQLLAQAGSAAAATGDHATAETLLASAIAELDENGALLEAAATRTRLAGALIDVNRLEQASELLAQAGNPEDDPRLASEIAALRAQIAFLRSDFERAYHDSDLALSIADPRRFDAVVADAAMTKGIALYFRDRLAEAGAMMALGLQVALDADLTTPTLRAYYNLADLRVVSGRGEESSQLIESGLALARQRGNRVWERHLLSQRAEIRIITGKWDEALADAVALRAGGDDEGSETATMMSAVIFGARGDGSELEALIARPMQRSEWHELAATQDAGLGLALHAAGQADAAVPRLEAIMPLVQADTASCSVFLGDVLEALLSLGRRDLVERIVNGKEHRGSALVDPQLACGRALLYAQAGDLKAAEQEFRFALDGLHRITVPFPLARCLVHYSSLLVELGRSGEAEPLLHEAHGLFSQLRALPWIERTDAALSPLGAAAR
ncbi:MAG: ATP-binding protein, partial [Solirubrobacteraceae bacterium]